MPQKRDRNHLINKVKLNLWKNQIIFYGSQHILMCFLWSAGKKTDLYVDELLNLNWKCSRSIKKNFYLVNLIPFPGWKSLHIYYSRQHLKWKHLASAKMLYTCPHSLIDSIHWFHSKLDPFFFFTLSGIKAFLIKQRCCFKQTKQLFLFYKKKINNARLE